MSEGKGESEEGKHSDMFHMMSHTACCNRESASTKSMQLGVRSVVRLADREQWRSKQQGQKRRKHEQSV